MQEQQKPRIPPLEPPYSPKTEEFLARWMKGGGENRPILNIFRTFAVHGELASRVGVLGAGLLGHPRITPREREILIHRTTANAGAQYEWGVHATALGRPLGFTDEHLWATVHGDAKHPVWSEQERLLIRLADELYSSDDVSDALWEELVPCWPMDRLLEMIITVGWYRTVSLVCNVSRVALEDWADRFPPASSASSVASES